MDSTMDYSLTVHGCSKGKRTIFEAREGFVNGAGEEAVGMCIPALRLSRFFEYAGPCYDISMVVE